MSYKTILRNLYKYLAQYTLKLTNPHPWSKSWFSAIKMVVHFPATAMLVPCRFHAFFFGLRKKNPKWWNLSCQGCGLYHLVERSLWSGSDRRVAGGWMGEGWYTTRNQRNWGWMSMSSPFRFFFWMNVRKDLRFQDPPGKCEHILSRQRHIFVDGFSMGFPDWQIV